MNILQKSISDIKRLTPIQIQSFAKLGIFSCEDLLRYTPLRYVSYADNISIENVESGSMTTLYGHIKKIEIRKAWKSKIPMTEAIFSDGVSEVKIFWFNQAYIGKMYPEGSIVSIHGKAEKKNGKLVFSNPSISKINKDAPEIKNPIDSILSNIGNPDENVIHKDSPMLPVYSETKGISSNFIHELIKRIILSPDFNSIDTDNQNKNNGKDINNFDILPENIRQEINLPTYKESIIYLHMPKNEKMALTARKRFMFEEMFLIQTKIADEKIKSSKSPAYKINNLVKDKNNISKDLIQEFLNIHNIELTNAQKKVVNDIILDISKNNPMQRLVEGDVGSGKTMVAACAVYATIKNRRADITGLQKDFGTPLQAVYLAPTEILALQQFETLIKMLDHTNIEIGYLSGKTAYKYPSKSEEGAYTKVSKPQLIKWVNEGKISLLVGTHAVTKSKVTFKDLALIIIDEQHRFGVNTRADLAHKKGDARLEIPHLLSMTATPIPRTLALSIFGDLDLSIIDELPKGRQPITTKIVHRTERDKIYKIIEEKLKLGQQAFVICTKIKEGEEDDGIRKNVESELLRLQKIFPKYNVSGIHSKMSGEEKENIMQNFADNKIQILVATSLVEVGVNIPNASIMIIENADRFGLSQLHQLRGRIGRGVHPSTCYVFSESESDTSMQRLKNFEKTIDGFKLAELDMETRGIGSLISKNQSGISDLGMEALKNIKLVEVSKKYAKQVAENGIQNYPNIVNKINRLDNLHME
jgi:ATP-dependent DNA helicase RecG